MWFGQRALLIFLISLSVDLTVAQDPSVSTTQWEFEQIVGTLIDRQNRVRSMIDTLAPIVNATLAIIRAKGGSPLSEKALDDLRDALTWLRTLDSYDQNNATWTCTEISVRVAGIQFDIQRTYQIYYEVVTNVTVLYTRLGALNIAYVTNYYTLTDSPRSNLTSVTSSLSILIDEYNQYGLTLLVAVYKYSRLYFELLFVKTNLCVCPNKLSTESSTALQIVDANINLIQKYVNDWESQIKEMSDTTIKKVNDVNPGLKSNGTFILLTQTLDNIVTLVTGYLLLTTYDNVNVTLTCDEAAMKIAFLEYKMEQYYQANIEAQKNATFVLVQLAYLNTYYAVNVQTLTEDQKQKIQVVVTCLNKIIEEFTNYVLSLATGWVKLLTLFLNAKNARYASCNCSGDAGTTLAPGSSTTRKLSMKK